MAATLRLFLAAALFSGACAMNYLAGGSIIKSQPKWYFLSEHSYKKLTHIMGVSLGFRALVADFDYILFLQYYGDRLNIKTRFKDLPAYLDSITDADPHFTFAYTYGSAILAFNQRRYDEAIKLIDKGLRYNPKEWKLHMYAGAIMFMQKGDTVNYIKFLEDAVKFEDHPAIIERLLGNIYEQVRDPDFAAQYWLDTYRNSKDRQTREHAYGRLMNIVSQGRLRQPEKILDKLQ